MNAFKQKLRYNIQVKWKQHASFQVLFFDNFILEKCLSKVSWIFHNLDRFKLLAFSLQCFLWVLYYDIMFVTSQYCCLWSFKLWYLFITVLHFYFYCSFSACFTMKYIIMHWFLLTRISDLRALGFGTNFLNYIYS